MSSYEVESIEIAVEPSKVVEYISRPENLPHWTEAFSRADQASATMKTPNGRMEIGLTTLTNVQAGSVDWQMKMPDGTVATAFSRVTPDRGASSIYSFVLMSPPGALEELEGNLDQQRDTLARELRRVKGLLEGHA